MAKRHKKHATKKRAIVRRPQQPARIVLETRTTRALPEAIVQSVPDVAQPLVDALALPAVGFGRLQISKEDATALAAPVAKDVIQILPTGEIYCLSPETRILYSDLTWRPIGDAKLGDELIGFDEHIPSKHQRRKLRPATVTATSIRTGQRVVVRLHGGKSITCSPDHKWLARSVTNSLSWIEARHLRVDDDLLFLGEPWAEDRTREGGYLADLFDGEGFLSIPKTSRPVGAKEPRGSFRIGFSQNPGAVLDTGVALLGWCGFKILGPRGNLRCKLVTVNGLYDCLRLLGQVRPLRLLERSRDVWNGKAFSGNFKTVLGVDLHGSGDLIDITTTTGTFIAEGAFSHNCPHIFVRRRLNEVFGPGGWGMRPCANPQVQGKTVVQPWLLMIRDQPVAIAYGEADYYENNDRMTWATAIESCKSNALTRACKDIGIAGECWDRKFARDFVREHCVVVDVRVYNRRDQNYETKQWYRLKDDPPFDNEIVAGKGEKQAVVDTGGQSARPVGQGSTGSTRGGAVISDGQLRRAMAIANQCGVEPETIHKYLADKFNYTFDAKKNRCTFSKLLKKDYDVAVQFIESQR